MRIFGRKLYGGYPMPVAKKRRIVVKAIEVVIEAAIVFTFVWVCLMFIGAAI